MKHFPAKNLCLLLLASMIWGTGFVAQAVGMDHLGPFAFNAIRSFVGGVALIPVLLFFGRFKSAERRAEERANRKTLLIGGLCCGLALGVASCLQQVGMQYTTVGKAGFITAMYIVIVPILGLFFHKKVGVKLWISVVIAMFGLYLLCMSGSLQLQKGDLLVLLCALAFSGHIMVIDHFSPKVDGVQMSCIQFFVASLFSMVCMLGAEGVPAAGDVFQVLGTHSVRRYPVLRRGLYPPDRRAEGRQPHHRQPDPQPGVRYVRAGRLAVPAPGHVRAGDPGLCADVRGHYSGAAAGAEEGRETNGISERATCFFRPLFS